MAWKRMPQEMLQVGEVVIISTNMNNPIYFIGRLHYDGWFDVSKPLDNPHHPGQLGDYQGMYWDYIIPPSE